MDLISRDKALMCATGCFPVDSERADECKTIAKRLSDCPSAFEGMTCSEVVKTLFPNAVIVRDRSYETIRVMFSDDVWSSPYKGVSE